MWLTIEYHAVEPKEAPVHSARFGLRLCCAMEPRDRCRPVRMWSSIDETLGHEPGVDGQHGEYFRGERCSIGKNRGRVARREAHCGWRRADVERSRKVMPLRWCRSSKRTRSGRQAMYTRDHGPKRGVVPPIQNSGCCQKRDGDFDVRDVVYGTPAAARSARWSRR